jgi:hypothetical protein
MFGRAAVFSVMGQHYQAQTHTALLIVVWKVGSMTGAKQLSRPSYA